jgi:hypothetical protein
VTERFVELAASRIGAERAARAVRLIERLETVARIDELTDLLVTGARASAARRRAGGT